jgi:hypothetical protein
MTKVIGILDWLVHNQRRSAVRRMVRAGVSEHVAMAISGHRTESVFRRYDITPPDDLRLAARRISASNNGTEPGAQSQAVEKAVDPF